MYGECIAWTPDSERTAPSGDDVKDMDDVSPHTVPSDGDVKNVDNKPTQGTGKLAFCSDPWIITAIAENNKLRLEVGTDIVTCDEDAARVAKVWSRDMCKYG